MKSSLTKLVCGLLLLLAGVAGTSLHAQVFSFNVDLNTAALVGNASAPFALDFQFNFGSGPQNTVTISNFQFTGGGAVGSPSVFGLATGDLGSAVTLTSNTGSFNNELFQGFSLGVTDIKFTVSVTQNGSGATPNGFEVAILDNTLGQIYTTDPNAGLSLVVLNASTHNTLSDVATYVSVAPSAEGVSATITAVPEPADAAAILGCLGMAGAFLRRRFGKSRAA